MIMIDENNSSLEHAELKRKIEFDEGDWDNMPVASVDNEIDPKNFTLYTG